MSAVAKAACWSKCRDCEETLVRRIGTGARNRNGLAGCTANSKSGAAASWGAGEILTAQACMLMHQDGLERAKGQAANYLEGCLCMCMRRCGCR